MTEKHSPLPWVADDDQVKMENSLLVAECYGGSIIESCANAALIVRAVNGLPEAIAALAGIVADMERKGMGDWPTAKKARAALTKLKG